MDDSDGRDASRNGLHDGVLRQPRHGRILRRRQIRISHEFQARRERRLLGTAQTRQLGGPGIGIHAEIPRQYPDISYGLATEATTSTVVASGASGKWYIPSSSFPSGWTTTAFNDATWTTGTTPLGYDIALPTASNYYYGQFGPNGSWHLYEVVNTAATWTNANNAARAKSVLGVSGHLVTLGSQTELNFVQSLLSDTTWIGLTNSSDYGGAQRGNTSGWSEPAEGYPPSSSQRGAGFVWCNGESFTFHDNVWNAGEPNGSGTTYVEMDTDGKWNDRTTASATHIYVIEYDLNNANINGFSIDSKHGGTLDSLQNAVDLLNNTAVTATNYSASAIDFWDPEDGNAGNFAVNNAFGGNSVGDDENFTLRVRGTLRITTAGTWTFGVNSDDGFSLKINGVTFNTLTGCTNSSGTNTMEYASPRGPENSFGTASLAAGNYEFELVYYEDLGGSNLEFFAAPGAKTAFDSTFRLVGDTANGGLPLLMVGNVAGTANPAFSTASFNTNTTALLRMPFTVSNPTSVSGLKLRVRYDDGFIAYLNGTAIALINAPALPVWNSTATADHLTGDAVRDVEIDVSEYANKLVAGPNILSFQMLNASATDTNMLLQPELTAVFENLTSNMRYFVLPTPGRVNGTGTSDLGPIVTDVSVPATQPGDSDNIVVTAKVRKTISNVNTSSVTLHYRVMYGVRSHCDDVRRRHARRRRARATAFTARRFPPASPRRDKCSAGTSPPPTRSAMPAAGRSWCRSSATTADRNTKARSSPIPRLTSTLPIFQTFIVNTSPPTTADGHARLGLLSRRILRQRFRAPPRRLFDERKQVQIQFRLRFQLRRRPSARQGNQPQPTRRSGQTTSYARPTVAFETMSEAGVAGEHRLSHARAAERRVLHGDELRRASRQPSLGAGGTLRERRDLQRLYRHA